MTSKGDQTEIFIYYNYKTYLINSRISSAKCPIASGNYFYIGDIMHYQQNATISFYHPWAKLLCGSHYSGFNLE